MTNNGPAMTPQTNGAITPSDSAGQLSQSASMVTNLVKRISASPGVDRDHAELCSRAPQLAIFSLRFRMLGTRRPEWSTKINSRTLVAASCSRSDTTPSRSPTWYGLRES